MTLPIHLQLLLTNPSVEVVFDNACTHGKRQRQRQPLVRTRSTPSYISRSNKNGSSRDAPKQRQVCRWESMPTKSTVVKDVAPVLARRKMGSPAATITIAASMRPPTRPCRDVAPVCRRPTRSVEDRKTVMSAIIDILDSSESNLSLQTTMDIFDEDLLSNGLDLCSMHSTITL